MAEKGKSRDMRLKITSCVEKYTGTNKRGDEFKLYEVTAEKTDGTVIKEKLRSFTALPIGQTLEVTVSAYENEKYGRSFTLQPKSDRKETMGKQLNDLAETVGLLSDTVQKLSVRIADVENRLGELLRSEGRGMGFANAHAEHSDGVVAQANANRERLDAEFGADAPW